MIEINPGNHAEQQGNYPEGGNRRVDLRQIVRGDDRREMGGYGEKLKGGDPERPITVAAQREDIGGDQIGGIDRHQRPMRLLPPGVQHLDGRGQQRCGQKQQDCASAFRLSVQPDEAAAQQCEEPEDDRDHGRGSTHCRPAVIRTRVRLPTPRPGATREAWDRGSRHSSGPDRCGA